MLDVADLRTTFRNCRTLPFFMGFVRTSDDWNLSSKKKIWRALALARREFSGKQRLNDEPYINHLICVASALYQLGVRDPNVICAALLHDLLEDIPSWNFWRLVGAVGWKIAILVFFVTKWKSTKRRSRSWRLGWFYLILRIGPKGARLIKIFDRLHNLDTSDVLSHWKRERIVVETESYYYPLTYSLIAEYPELHRIVRRVLWDIANEHI